MQLYIKVKNINKTQERVAAEELLAEQVIYEIV